MNATLARYRWRPQKTTAVYRRGDGLLEIKATLVDITPFPWEPGFDGWRHFDRTPARYYLNGTEVSCEEADAWRRAGTPS